ncbi:5875_t:CDS:2, partial [Dentiscutata erythropus]
MSETQNSYNDFDKYINYIMSLYSEDNYSFASLSIKCGTNTLLVSENNYKGAIILKMIPLSIFETNYKGISKYDDFENKFITKNIKNNIFEDSNSEDNILPKFKNIYEDINKDIIFESSNIKNENVTRMFLKGIDNRLSRIFWMFSEQKSLWAWFYDVIINGNICKTNKYLMPLSVFVIINSNQQSHIIAIAVVSDETISTYEWILKQTKLATGNIQPKAIFTDADFVIQVAIFTQYPDTIVWHSNTYLTQHVKSMNWVIKLEANSENSLYQLQARIKLRLKDEA